MQNCTDDDTPNAQKEIKVSNQKPQYKLQVNTFTTYYRV
jgi:hypothetical protein